MNVINDLICLCVAWDVWFTWVF